MKAVLRGKLIVLNAYKKKLERAYPSSVKVYLNVLEQKEANTQKKNRRQEIIKLRAKINHVDIKRTKQRINKTRSWFFEENQEDR